MILRATVVLGLLISLAAGPSEAQQRCTTTYNQVFKQYETHCSDGSRTTESYNPVFKQWESTTTPGSGQYGQPAQRCTRTYNEVFKQWETVCR